MNKEFVLFCSVLTMQCEFMFGGYCTFLVIVKSQNILHRLLKHKFNSFSARSLVLK